MAKTKRRKRPTPAPMSEKQQRARADAQRIRRELAAVRRVAELSKRLEHASARAETATFTLGRELVMRNGFAVVSEGHSQRLQTQNAELRARIAELVEQLALRPLEEAHA